MILDPKNYRKMGIAAAIVTVGLIALDIYDHTTHEEKKLRFPFTELIALGTLSAIMCWYLSTRKR